MRCTAELLYSQTSLLPCSQDTALRICKSHSISKLSIMSKNDKYYNMEICLQNVE